MNKKTKRIILLTILLIIIVSALFILVKFIIPSYITISKEKSCLENINRQIDEDGLIKLLEDPKYPLEKALDITPSSVNSVANYLICESIINNNVDDCDKLKEIKRFSYEGISYDADSFFRTCKDFLIFFVNFLDRVEREQKCGQEAINNCLEFMEGSDEGEKETKCKNFCEAYLAKDISICSEPPKTKVNSIGKEECLALISGDEKYCENLEYPASVRQCILASQYFSAIRNKDRNECDLIKIDTEKPDFGMVYNLPNFKMLCDLYFDKSISICEKELDTFKENYCREK